MANAQLDKNSYSIREEKELLMIKDGLQHDAEKQEWTVSYPWIKEARLLPNNVCFAIRKMKITENRLRQMGHKHAQLYQEQFNDMVNRGSRENSQMKRRGCTMDQFTT